MANDIAGLIQPPLTGRIKNNITAKIIPRNNGFDRERTASVSKNVPKYSASKGITVFILYNR